MTVQFRRDNHFVPRAYLKRWLAKDGRLWTYRLLVPHSRCELWRPHSTRGLAYHSHLYTRIVGGQESDDFERWLTNEFEVPAEGAFAKAISGRELTADDWNRLVRFAAAQDTRTPARFEEQMKRWRATLPQLIQETLSEGMEKFQKLKSRGKPIPNIRPDFSKDCPLEVQIEKSPNHGGTVIKAEVSLGRSFWLWNMKQLLEKTSRVLHQHKWTILVSPEGVFWPTSDNPVIRLNFSSMSKYDFGGGWGSPGSEILLPLSPRHLLYTEIEGRPPARGARLNSEKAHLIKRLMAEHAHRMIFAVEPDQQISHLRPRVVDMTRWNADRAQWRNWHKQQVEAELSSSSESKAG